MSQESNQSSEYIPSQSTPDSEDYTSYESSSLETPSESDYSIASSSQGASESDYNSSYFDETESEEEEYIEQFKIDGSRSSQPDVKI